MNTDTLLRSLDPAAPPADPRSASALALRDRVLATPPGAAPRKPVRRRRGLAVSVGAAAAAAAGFVAMPAVIGGDAAFGTWTPDPRPLVGQDRTDAADGCRDTQRDGAGSAYAAQLASARTAAAERRGAWTAVVLSGDDGFGALCLTDSSRHLFRDTTGSVGVADVPTPDPRGLSATDLGTSEMSAGEMSLAAGLAGDEVVGVALPRTDGVPVEATVAGGRFFLWVPGDALRDAASEGVSVEVTYRDGSTARVRLHL